MEPVPYLEDIYPPDLLYAATVRSPVSKGYIKFIQVPVLPNDYYFITAKNIPGKNKLEGTDIPILADSKLSYFGEPIAIFLGPDKTKLEELASRCIVIVDEVKAIFDYQDPLYETSSNEVNREITQAADKHGKTEKSVKTISGRYSTGIQEHWYAEPIGAVTWYKDENKKKILTVRTATQWPFHIKRSVINALGIEASGITVEPTALSIHMDGKLWYPSLIACHAAIGTFITKRPVRLILSKDEDFQFTPKRCKTDIIITSNIDDKGCILKTDVDIIVNLGAYGVNENEIIDQVSLGSLGLYKFDNFSLLAKGIKTNLPPQGPFSGFGLAHGLFAIERHISQIADACDYDPALWRLNNVNNQVILPKTVSTKNNKQNELLNTAINMSDYYRKWSSFELLKQSRKENKTEKYEKLRGIGIAVGYQGNSLLHDKNSYSVEVTLTKEGFLEIKTSIVSTEDYSKIWEKVAFQTMSIEPHMVRIISTDSNAKGSLPDCGPSCSSRNITTITKLVEKCCLAIRKQRFHAPLPISVRRSIKPQSGSLRNGSFAAADINGFLKPGLAAAVVEVTIDPVECMPIARGIWLAVDGGKIISINRSKRALTRGIVQALGWAFSENIEYVNGKFPGSQYDNYNILSPVDIPPIYIDFISDNPANNEGDTKGIGDLPFTCIPAAFLQAVSQAMDHCFKSIPLKRKNIWELFNLQNDNSANNNSGLVSK
ncbi:MAG: molybdopterin-dependent oxidoreductase [Treponema sp.]|nr:molybdopterin-dependent oxidoreductase [Treponema sp.]